MIIVGWRHPMRYSFNDRVRVVHRHRYARNLQHAHVVWRIADAHHMPHRYTVMRRHMLQSHRLDALIAPTTGPAWTSDVVNGDHYVGGGASRLPAVAGYPHVTVPMGLVDGLPVGLSFIGGAWTEARLLSYAYAYEQRAQARRPPTYIATLNANAPFVDALRPARRDADH